MRHLAVLLLVATIPAQLTAQPRVSSQPRPLLLTGVTVIDATGGPARPGMSVVIAAGRIAQLGKTGKVAAPDNARVVDASGKFLIPGLWDLHVHWYDEPSLPLFTANGVTGVRVMCGYPLHLSWRKKVSEGMLLGPRMVLAGPIVDGPEPVWPDSIRASNRAEGRLAVQAIKRQGYDCVKVYNLLPLSAYLGAADEARKLGLPLVGHLPFDVSAAEASEAGQKSIEHLSGISLACSSREEELHKKLAESVVDHAAPVTAVQLRFEIEAEDSFDGTKAAALFARFVKNGTYVVPTLTVRQAHALLSDRARETSLPLRYLPSSMKERWDSRRAATLRKLGPEDFANFKQSFRKQLELVSALHRAGVSLLAGTDTGALDCFPGFSLHEELELLVKAGLTPLEALQSATRNPAQFLGRLNDQGTIEQGKLADLVLLDANPLEDIRNTRKIHAAVVNGRLLLGAELRVMLDEVEAACKRKQPDRPPGAHDRYP